MLDVKLAKLLSLALFTWWRLCFVARLFLLCSLAVSVHALLRMMRDSNKFLCSSTISLFVLRSRWVHPKYTQSRNVGCSRSTCFIIFFHMGLQIPCLPSHLDVIHVHGQKMTLLTMHKQAFPGWCFLPSISPKELIRTVSPTRIQQGGERFLSR